jgi:hypothetical protein
MGEEFKEAVGGARADGDKGRGAIGDDGDES